MRRILAAALILIMTVTGIPATGAEAEELFSADAPALTFFEENAVSPTELPASPTEARAAAQTVSMEDEADTFAEGEVESWTLRYSYDQSSAREMLSLVNSFRTGSEAWAYGTSGAKEYRVSLSALNYDYALEEAAIQRAAEAAVRFSHERPDGTLYTELLSDSGGDTAENILCLKTGATTAAEAMEVFKESDKGYSGQLERRTMLGAYYRAVGIAHAEYKGFDIWVQLFSKNISGAAVTEAADGTRDVSVDILSSIITSSSVYQPEKKYLTLVSGEPAELSMAASAIPEVSRQLTVTGSPEGIELSSAPLSVTWTSEDTGIARIFGGRVVAGGGGRTRLLGSSDSWTGDITVTVIVPATAIKLKVTEATLQIGQTWRPELEITPAGAYGYITSYSSDNTACATVSDDGLITAVGAGQAAVSVRVMTREVDLVKETVCYITVAASGDNGESEEGEDGGDGTESATVKTAKYMVVKQKIKINAGGKITRWVTSDKTVATVKRVGAKKKGTARVTAKGLGPNGSGEVTITGYNGADVVFRCSIKVEKPIFNKDPVVLSNSFLVSDRIIGTSLTKPTKYKTSNKKVLAVDKTTGEVTVKKNGTATLLVYYGKVRYKVKLKVRMPRIKKSSVKVKHGKTKTLKIKYYRADTVYKFKIEDGGESIASVRYGGGNTFSVYGITKGTTRVTIYVGGVAYDTCRIRVK